MRRHKSLVPLSRFHRSILFLALNLKKNAPAVKGYPDTTREKIEYALTFYRKQLTPHFILEKEKLFPQLRGRDDRLDKLIHEIESDREYLKQLFERLDGNETDSGELDQLGMLLEKHIRKEERKLFEMIQEIFEEDELDKIDL